MEERWVRKQWRRKKKKGGVVERGEGESKGAERRWGMKKLKKLGMEVEEEEI